MEEPLSSQLWRYEPDLGKHASPELWQVRTNFVEPKDIMRRFGAWPDDVLTPEILDSLYLGKTVEGGEQFIIPFLDDAEGTAISRVWERYKDAVLVKLRSEAAVLSISQDTGEASSPEPARPVPSCGPFLLALQALIILELRSREQESGVWEMRIEAQRLGTAFAIRPGTNTTFTRVDVMPLGGDSLSILCVPWGGPFNEYAKLIQLLANRHTRRIISSADEKLEVVPEGPVLKMMVAAGLLRELRQSYLDSHWSLSVPIVDWKNTGRIGPSLAHLARGISEAVSPGIIEIVNTMRSGRYATVDGVGDYVEMTYSVLLGMTFEWAMEDGLLRRPPVFKDTKNGPVLERAKKGSKHMAPDPLPGIGILKNSGAAWDDLRVIGC